MINSNTNQESISLQPRHQVIVDFLTNKAPKRYSAKAIATECKLSASTTGNEMLTVMRLCSKVQRSVRGRVYKYYVGQPESTTVPKGFEDYGKPIPTVSEVGQIFSVTTKEGYVSAPARLGWKLPQALCQLVDAALTDDPSRIGSARQAIEELSDAATAYAVALSRILATEELWDNPQWLTAGMPEENLEKLRETTSATQARLAKLGTSKQGPKETD